MKQRVIGAIVLVAIAVIFLPMLLQGPDPERGASDVPLDLPEPPEREFEVRELPLGLPPPSETATETGEAAEPVPDPDRVVAVEADAPARVDALEDGGSTAVSPAAGQPAAEQPAAEQPMPATQAGGDYVVNLGSYRQADNARSLLDAFTQAGLPAYGEKVRAQGAELTRLRLGPFARRGDAEAARLQARRVRADVPAEVVALSEARADNGTARELPDTGFAVQVGAFAKAEDAQALRERLRAAGIPAFSEAVRTEGGTLHRVRAGPEIDRAAAERLRERIKTEFKLDGLVVAFP